MTGSRAITGSRATTVLERSRVTSDHGFTRKRTSMRTSVRTVTAISAVALFWAGLAYDLSRPADYRAYHRTVLQVAAVAYDAAQTGRLIGEQVLADKATKPYATTTFDDAIKALAGAQKQFA